METTEEVVRNYLKNELKQKGLSKEDKALLKNTLSYMTNKREIQVTEWKDFLARAEENKKCWETIYPVEGLFYKYKLYESEGMLNFGMDVGTERSRTWLFNVNIFIHSNRRIIFECIDEEMDELELSSFEELEEKIELFLASVAFKDYIEDVKKHSL